MLDLGELARAVRAILGEASCPSRRRRRSRQRHPFGGAEARSFVRSHGHWIRGSTV